MKRTFFLCTFLLLFSRGCDFYSTSLWFFDNPTGETNPLYRFFGVGWAGLITANVLLIGLILYAFYWYSFRYRMPAIHPPAHRLTDFVSQLYFYERGRFMEILYRLPKNKEAYLSHLGYVLVRVVILGSFMATFHNLCQFYQASFYHTYREWVGRPLYVIYGLLLLSVVYFTYRLWRREFTRHLNALPSQPV